MIKQITRFVLVGSLAFLIDFFILYSLTNFLGFYFLISSAIAFSISIIFNYLLSSFWVFNINKNISHMKRITIFITLSLIGLIINQVVMYIGVKKFKIFYINAKIISTVIVMIWNFVTKKLMFEK